MTNFVLKNNASTTLAAAAAPGATTLTLASATNFPSSIPSGFVLALTLNDAATRSIFEIVYVTAISGTTLTVLRGQEGTTAQNWNVGDYAFVGITAGVEQALGYGNGQTYASDAGVANAYAVSLTPPLTAHVVGLPIRWRAAHSNTGASTFNDGAGAVNLILPNGSTLPGGAITAGGIYTSAYDGTNFQLVSAQSSSNFLLGALTLAGSAAGGTKTASWTAKQIIAATALNGLSYEGINLTLNFNGAGTGAGGMDTGATPTSGDLYVYAIYNPSTNTWSTLGTVTADGGNFIYQGINMPSGYTASYLLWSGKTDVSGNVVAFGQIDRRVKIGPTTVLSGGVSAPWTAVSLSSCVPANGKAVSGHFSCSISSGDSTVNSVSVASASASPNVGDINFALQDGSSGGGDIAVPYPDISLLTAQTLYYGWNVRSTGSLTISVSGYTF